MATATPGVVLPPTAVHDKTGLALQTLANWRNLTNRGQVTGPKFFKFGRLVRYFETDVDAWIAEQAKAS